MRILLLHPNYHSGGAEIAGNWPPAWVAYLTGYLKDGGYHDITFVDAMTHHLDDEQVRARIAELQPDIVGCTAITPAIYKAERLLQIAKEVNPAIVTVLGGIHGTFMYPQVLKEAPWIDAVVRGEGEQVFLNLVRAVDDGSFARDRNGVRGIAFADGDVAQGIKGMDPISSGQLSREEMLRLALMSSENRAAAALLRTYPGGKAAGVAAMNRKARTLGMTSSRFVEATGLSGDNRATPADLVRMVKELGSMALAEGIEVGNLSINHYVASSAETPSLYVRTL